MAFLDDIKQWTDFDTAAAELGRSLGLFAAGTGLTQVKAVLLTNGAVGNTLYGLLDRMAWLGLLERDDDARRYRAAPPRLHPLGEPDDVPALEAGPPARAQINMSVDGDGFRLDADRAGFRHLARVFEEIADSGLQSGWRVQRDAAFRPGAGAPAFSFRLVDPAAD